MVLVSQWNVYQEFKLNWIDIGRIITKQAENGAIEIDEETFTEDGERLVKEMIAAAESQKVRRSVLELQPRN